tara:strand:- start:581 stop:1465 length:885 start_codon:yes stop_codon:yes gene_type:complete
MSITRQNLSVIIVSFKSDHVIHKCINSIDNQMEIIVVDNSNDVEFKKEIERKYNNVKCILSSSNIGMGAGNNLGIKNVSNDYAFILNPDVILQNDSIDEIIKDVKSIDSFGLVAPISDKIEYPNYKLDKNKNQSFDPINPFKVKSVDGYAMLLNLKQLRKIKNFNFFDENFFLYLENEDLCLELSKNNINIFVIPKSKISHLGGEAVDYKFKDEIELSRNWHWMWSKFYFNKKHYGYLFAIFKVIKNLISAKIKFFYYLITFNNKKRRIYQMRLFGLLSSMIGRKSFYRPKLDN